MEHKQKMVTNVQKQLNLNKRRYHKVCILSCATLFMCGFYSNLCTFSPTQHLKSGILMHLDFVNLTMTWFIRQSRTYMNIYML